MKQFYINTNKACVLNFIWGGKPQPLIKTSVKVYIIHTFAMESPSFSSPLIGEEKRKK
jgi:hypothetical protein